MALAAKFVQYMLRICKQKCVEWVCERLCGNGARKLLTDSFVYSQKHCTQTNCFWFSKFKVYELILFDWTQYILCMYNQYQLKVSKSAIKIPITLFRMCKYVLHNSVTVHMVCSQTKSLLGPSILAFKRESRYLAVKCWAILSLHPKSTINA
jgi:hypothetical protein